MAAVAAAFLCFGSDANAQKTTKLFNGKDLSNWNFVVDKNSVPPEQVYSVSDGVIKITGQPFGYMYTTIINCTWNGVGRTATRMRTAVSSC